MLFCEFVEQIGVKLIINRTGIPERTLRSWARLERLPAPQSVLKVIEKFDGLISWEEVYLPFALMRGKGLTRSESLALTKECIAKAKASDVNTA